jgi:ubiquinone/menaquinone biosynthesis C-methylase UbiE
MTGVTSEASRRAQLTAGVAAAFDEAASGYDSGGPHLAGPIASRLVGLADLQPGWHVLDVGCGAGAVLVRAASAVSPGGHVTGIDLAPRMLQRAASEAVLKGLGDCVTLRSGDAAEPALGPFQFDAVLASLVLYLLPDPRAALEQWGRLLTPGGRVAFSWGVKPDPRWLPVFRAVETYAGTPREFFSYVGRLPQPDGMQTMLTTCGYTRVAITVETVTIRYDHPDQWWETSLSEGPWVTWRHIPPARMPEARADAMRLLEPMREPDGSLTRQVRMGYAVAHRREEGR